MIDLSKYSEEHIDSIILDYYNEWCVLPEWTKDTKSDFLVLPPKILWYPVTSNRESNYNIFCGGVTTTSTPGRYSDMKDPTDNKVYNKYFHNTLLDLIIRIGFFRVGLINESVLKDISFKEQVQGVIRHEWRHVLQQLYLMKVDIRTKGNKYTNIKMMYLYGSENQIIEEDAREVQFSNPNKPIEDFYREYKRYDYIYLKRNSHGRIGKTTTELILED